MSNIEPVLVISRTPIIFKIVLKGLRGDHSNSGSGGRAA